MLVYPEVYVEKMSDYVMGDFFEFFYEKKYEILSICLRDFDLSKSNNA